MARLGFIVIGGLAVSSKWKSHLLKSSLPLEYSVTQALREIGFSSPREFRYERPNEHGITTTFSIDLRGTLSLNSERVRLEAFIECKYRDPTTNWVFLPESFAGKDSVDFVDTYVMLDKLNEAWLFNSELVNSFAGKYLACGKGIEITTSGANPKSITQAIYQLKYSMIQSAKEAMIDQLDDFLGNTKLVHVLVPIIVTTADLWRLTPGSTVESITRAEEIGDVAEKTDILFVQERPDNELIRFSQHKLWDEMGDFDKERMADRLKEIGERSPKYFFRRFSERYPSVFVVIHYDAVKEKLVNMTRFFEQERVVVSKPAT